MATENKKMKDPAEAALSAVEQALNLDETFVIHTPERPGGKSSFEEPKLPDIDDHDFTKGPFGLGSDFSPRRPTTTIPGSTRCTAPASSRPTGTPSPTTTARMSA